jgi:exportin-2 (importin alpha re-exporter)
VDENGTYKLPESEDNAVKQELVGLMVSVAPGLQAVLGEAISTIAESDFYERWESLVDVCVLKQGSRGYIRLTTSYRTLCQD